MTLPTAVLSGIQALQARGAHVYMVGGTVRDMLLGYPEKDLDLLVTGMPQPDMLRTLRPYGRIQLTGRAFGVLKFQPRGWEGPPIDIALPRTEVSTGIGHRDFAVTFDHTLPVDVDLGRRDFTINAMAIDLADERLIDPFGGQADIACRQLRQVSPLAFPEDPLRMLRGVQLATRFRLDVAPDTYTAMCTHAPTIATVAAERIAEELRKLFQATAPSRGVLLLYATGLLERMIPELAELARLGTPQVPLTRDREAREMVPVAQAFAHTLHRLDALQQCEVVQHRGALDLLLAALLSACGVPQPALAEAWTPQHSAQRLRARLEALKVTTIGAQLDRILTIMTQSALEVERFASPAQLRHFVHDVGVVETHMILDFHLADRLAHRPPQPIDDLLAIRQQLATAVTQQVPLGLKDLAVNGNDLQRLGIPAGPQLGRTLAHLLACVLDDPRCNTREYLLALAHAVAPTTL